MSTSSSGHSDFNPPIVLVWSVLACNLLRSLEEYKVKVLDNQELKTCYLNFSAAKTVPERRDRRSALKSKVKEVLQDYLGEDYITKESLIENCIDLLRCIYYSSKKKQTKTSQYPKLKLWIIYKKILSILPIEKIIYHKFLKNFLDSAKKYPKMHYILYYGVHMASESAATAFSDDGHGKLALKERENFIRESYPIDLAPMGN